ncbi:MAG: molybdopterin/thiamine biosynthesis adenylyltransferase/rhodanese-related sulfurtransferase [Maribacter sp.]|jgi:molybdopterin/thiamine biosynthesis adenylyltransferase/rhodanese-related sulfurtransferase
MGSILSSAEMARYARHITIPEFGVAGQEKLKQAKVLVIGSGGLGSPVLLYLAAAGVGHIGIVDFDVVDDSNLQRQVLFTVEDIGKSKAETAKKRLEALNPYINITVYNTAFTKDNALDIIKDYDIVADGTDNFPTRYLVNDACVLAGKVNVYGSIFRFEGQVSVFNFLKEDGTRGPNYRHMFPEPPPPGLVPNCAEGGVLGVLPGIIGSLQASEVIKVITGVGQPLVGKLFLFDVAAFETRTLKINTQQNIEITELINYESFCGLDIEEEPVKEVTVQELDRFKTLGLDFQLIDVRESFEYEIANIGGKLIPLSTVKDNLDKISKTKQVIIHCKSGARSTNAIKELEELYPFDNLYNLKGGILAYANEIDDRIPVY